jgi:glycerol uptake operon antiterminator
MSSADKTDKVRAFFKRMSSVIKDAIFPEDVTCDLCGEELVADTRYRLCAKCTEDMPFIAGHICLNCGVAIDNEADYCDRCQNNASLFKLCRAPLLYDGKAREMLYGLKFSGKKYLVHLDLAKGVGKDESGIRFLKRIGVDGVISTKVNIIKMARECDMFTVQRFFMVDSHSFDTSLDALKNSKPNMIEIMPGTLTKIIGRLRSETDLPIVAGGLIETRDEIEEALSCGAYAVSTGKKEFWS